MYKVLLMKNRGNLLSFMTRFFDLIFQTFSLFIFIVSSLGLTCNALRTFKSIVVILLGVTVTSHAPLSNTIIILTTSNQFLIVACK